MSKRLALLLALALVGAACGEPPSGEIDFGSGRQFVPQIADSTDDVGLGAAIALDADGVPFISYFGFPARLAEGEIPVGRPVGAPFVPAVLIASQRDGVWNRGAVAMDRDAPALVSVPFGPDTVETLSTATPDNTNGTDVAVGADGTMHVVWAAADGIWYAGGTDSFAAEKVISHLPPLSQAGPLGWPAVAVDGDGNPWVAATVTAPGGGQEVVAATSHGGGWDVQTVAELAACGGCPQPERTGIAVGPDGPVVVYADPAGQAVMAARLQGRSWISEVVEAGADGAGISATTGKDGTLYAAYYADRQTVRVATSDGKGWAARDVATVGSGKADGQSTGVAVADDGTVYLTYVDPGASSVVLTSAEDGGGFEPIPTIATEGGQWPAVDVTPDGATVSLAWYDPQVQDLAYATFADSGGLVLAAPSPTFVPSQAPGAGSGCTADTTKPVTDVTVVAAPGAQASNFEQTCVVVPAGQEVSITFDNQDPGQMHNLSGYTDSSAADQLFTSGPFAPGPETQGPAPFGPFDEGTYYFQCDVHPTTMNGIFIVAKAKKKK
ncbi:MAG: hypothetical protein ABJC60_06040 [Actinomycetota bacterium]